MGQFIAPKATTTQRLTIIPDQGELVFDTTTNKLYGGDGTTTGGFLIGNGDVSGPSSAVNNRVVFFDGTTGKLIKDSGLTLSGTNTGDQTITLTGDVTGSGTGSFAATISAGSVTLAKMANLAANSIIGNNTGSAATPIALSGTNVTAMLDVFSSTLKGLAPASGGGTTNFLRADGTWAAPPNSGGTVTSITASSPLTGGTITSSGTIGIQQASDLQSGYLSALDWSSMLKLKSTTTTSSLSRAGNNARIGTSNLSSSKNLTITVYDEDAIKITTDVSVGPTVIDIAPGYIPGTTTTDLKYNGDSFMSLIGNSVGSSPSFYIYGSDGALSSQVFLGGIVNIESGDGMYLTAATTLNMSATSIRYTNGTNYVGFQLPTLTADSLYTLPVAKPTSNKVLQSDSSGVMTWITPSSGTVTSVAELTLGTSGTDLSSTVTNGTTTPVITLNVPTASASNRGVLSSADWSTFNGKQSALSGTGIVKSTSGTISYLTDNSANWDTAYTNRITSLTTTGSSGSATLVSNTLNIPTYTLAGLGGFANPMTTDGDIIYGGASGVATRLAGSGTNGWVLTYDTATNAPKWAASPGGTTYTFSTGLTESAGVVTNNLLTGVAGGQTVIGGTAVSDNLTLLSNNTGTRGKILFGTLSAYDELNDRLGIGTTSPTGKVTIVNGTASQVGFSITSSSTTSSAFALTHSTSVTSGILQGAQIAMNLNPTASSAASNRSLYMSVQLNSSNGSAFTGNPTAGWFECRILQAGAITRLTGGTFYGAFIPASGVTGTINVALAEGLFVTVAYSGQPGITGTITAARGMYITQSNVSSSSVTVASQVGIIMDAMTTATTSNSHIVMGQATIPSGNWGIYSSTTNASYFAGNVLLNTTTNSGYRLDVNGTGRYQAALTTTGRIQATVTKSAAYTLTATDRIVFVTASAGYNITLPTASTGQEYTIVKTDATANTITINTTGAARINGATTYTGLSAQYKHITVVFNGSDWFITSSN